MFSWYFTLFNYIWNLTSLILDAGDIKTNLGPKRPNLNPAICAICSKRIDKEPTIEAAATCYDQQYEVQCHLNCNSLMLSLSRHTKTMGKEIRWSCPQHGHEKREIIAQVQTSDKPLTQVKRDSASGKPCSVCGKTIQARYATHSYCCSEPSCD